MTVYNSDKTEILETYDLEKGKLVEDTITVHIDAVQGQELEAYYDQEDGNKYKVVKPYIKAVAEHDEEKPILKYVLYTEDELALIQLEKQKNLLRQEKAEKEAWLKSHDYIGIKIATGRATADDYATEIATMTEYANKINQIDTILGE